MYNKVPIAGWQGWDESGPQMALPPSSFRSVINFILNKGRIYSAPNVGALTSPPNALPILGGTSFIDILDNYHTLVLTQTQAYYLTDGGTYTPVGSPFLNPAPYPFSLVTLQNKVYFVNGGQPITACDGSAIMPVVSPYTGYFLGKLDSHLILAFTLESIPGITDLISFPFRIRWSASGDPTNWTDFTSGAADLPDVEDRITGFATLGVSGYIFRNQGISVMTPTGNGLAPFHIENFSVGQQGIGCDMPFSLAQFGTLCVFKGVDDIYTFDGANPPQRVGGKAKKTMFVDIANRSNIPCSSIITDLGGGKDYLSYWLSIPQAGDAYTVTWILHFDSNSWVRLVSDTIGRLTFAGNLATA